MSNYLKEAFLQSNLNGVAFPSLPSLWLALALGTPFTPGSYASEVVGNGYVRPQLTAAFTISDAGGDVWQAKNTAAIAYPAATGNWGNPPTDKVVGWGFLDALIAGNLVDHGPLGTPIAVYAGNVVYFDPLALVISAVEG